MSGSGTNRKAKNITDGPAVVLIRPQMGENIGAVARAMANFGLSELRIVAPRDGWPNPAAVAMAASASSIIENAILFDDLKSALSDCHYVLCTSARPHEQIKPIVSPKDGVTQLYSHHTQGQKTALMFGPERAGLENEDISWASAICSIPANPAYASLNLAQAVVILGYEWFSQAHQSALPSKAQTFERASRAELFSLMDFFEEQLTHMGYFRPPHKAPVMARNLRNILHRLELNAQDVKTFYGALQALVKGPMPLSGKSKKP